MSASEWGPMDDEVRHLRRARQLLMDMESWSVDDRTLLLAEVLALVEDRDCESPLFELLDRAVSGTKAALADIARVREADATRTASSTSVPPAHKNPRAV